MLRLQRFISQSCDAYGVWALSGAQHHWSLAVSGVCQRLLGSRACLGVLLVDSSDREPRRSKNRNLPGGNRVDPTCHVSVRVEKALAGFKATGFRALKNKASGHQGDSGRVR